MRNPLELSLREKLSAASGAESTGSIAVLALGYTRCFVWGWNGYLYVCVFTWRSCPPQNPRYISNQGGSDLWHCMCCRQILPLFAAMICLPVYHPPIKLSVTQMYMGSSYNGSTICNENQSILNCSLVRSQYSMPHSKKIMMVFFVCLVFVYCQRRTAEKVDRKRDFFWWWWLWVNPGDPIQLWAIPIHSNPGDSVRAQCMRA